MAKGRPGRRRLAVLAVTRGGCRLGRQVAVALDAEFVDCAGQGVRAHLARLWSCCEGLVCIMATGIVVRLVAPLLEDKEHDPAVVVSDEKGRYAISLLSGHLGGANQLAREVAGITGGQAVITTASDVCGRTGLDLWIREQRLIPGQGRSLTSMMAQLVNQGSLRLFSEGVLAPLPSDLRPVDSPDRADMVVTCRLRRPAKGLLLHPPVLVVGIGCNRGTTADEIQAVVQATLAEQELAWEAVASLATIDLKKDEAGLLGFAERNGLELAFYSREALNQVAGTSQSATVFRATGAWGVAEPAAILGAGQGPLLVPKVKAGNVTVAVAGHKTWFTESGKASFCKGK